MLRKMRVFSLSLSLASLYLSIFYFLLRMFFNLSYCLIKRKLFFIPYVCFRGSESKTASNFCHHLFYKNLTELQIQLQTSNCNCHFKSINNTLSIEANNYNNAIILEWYFIFMFWYFVAKVVLLLLLLCLFLLYFVWVSESDVCPSMWWQHTNWVHSAHQGASSLTKMRHHRSHTMRTEKKWEHGEILHYIQSHGTFTSQRSMINRENYPHWHVSTAV